MDWLSVVNKPTEKLHQNQHVFFVENIEEDLLNLKNDCHRYSYTTVLLKANKINSPLKKQSVFAAFLKIL